ncbi:MAG: hypothetical protein KDE63_03965 [Novosphingobium sp.]|nr:hypothetical protein [Novosphingobium sp.]
MDLIRLHLMRILERKGNLLVVQLMQELHLPPRIDQQLIYTCYQASPL